MEKPPASTISNALVTSEQLRSSVSLLDGIPDTLERTLRFRGCVLTQAAGILLQLNQDIIAQAIVIFTRFFVGSEGGSFRMHGVKNISAASLYLMAKLSATPQNMRAVLNAYAYLVSPVSPLASPNDTAPSAERPNPATYTLSEGQYQAQRITLMENEALILRQIGYATKVTLPHSLALTYVQTIASSGTSLGQEAKKKLAARTVALLNSALFSPQLLYLTHQPHELAVAAIYLAARETGCKIGGGEWWLVWDVTREELGFLVVALRSVDAWTRPEAGLGGLWTVVDVEAHLKLPDGSQ